MTVRGTGCACLLALALILLQGSPSSAKPLAPDAELSFELRHELERVLKAHAAELRKQRDDQDRHFRRGTYSKKFRRIDDRTVKVAFIRDTARGERMLTERFDLTLRRADDGAWSIVDERLNDSYDRLIRDVPGDERFYRFAQVALDLEGLRVRGTEGSLFVDTLDGEIYQIYLRAPDLSYVYEPPVQQGNHRTQVYGILLDERRDDFVFEPERLAIQCDPATCAGLLEQFVVGLAETSRDLLDATLRRTLERAEERQQKLRAENPFAGFRARARPDRRFYSISIKKKGKDHLLRLAYDTHAGWEVLFSASGYGPLFGYPAEASRAAGVSPYDFEYREDRAARDFQLTRLEGRVQIGFDDAELLKAELEYTMEIKRDLREIPFSLNDLTRFGGRRANERNPSIIVDSLETGDGEDLTWVRFGPAAGLVILPEEVRAGTRLVLRMEFHNRGSILKFSPSYSYMDRGGWLPFVRYTDKIEEFALTVVTPAKYKTLGIGTRVSDEIRGDLRESRWVAQHPVHFPTIIFGDYYEDTPRIRATKFDGTEIPVTIHVDRDGMQDWNIRPRQLRPLAEQAVNALNFYRELYEVDYPYGKLDMVNDPLGAFYGQAPASIIYLGSAAFRGEVTLADGARDARRMTRSARTLVAHEVAHQWWGSLVGTANRRNYWFVESLAEYSSALFLEIVESDGAARPDRARRAYLDEVAGWREVIFATDLLAGVQDASSLWSNGGYYAAVYNKGPYVFHMLRETFGDEKFFVFLENLGREFAGKEIVSRDIQRVAETSLGGVESDGTPYTVDLDWFFDQWIRGVGVPEYRFEYDVRATEDGHYVVEGLIRQRVVAGNKNRELEGVFYKGVVPITVLGNDDREYPARIIVDGPATRFGFRVPVRPLDVTLNKYGEILARDVIVEDR